MVNIRGGESLSINERVKAVRNALNLTQKDFGQKLTLAQTYLSQIEKGDRDVTEKIQKLICFTFNVSEEWLQTGIGDMFVESDSTILSQLSKEYGLDSFEHAMISSFLKMNPTQRKALKEYVKALIAETSATNEEIATETTPDLAAMRVVNRDEEEEKLIARGVELMREQFELEKKQEA
ncbi:XRE family transcriptional regulator [bacterium 1XD42-1]|nr:XRE family transcriptional regulator [bacterium 1XD42-8]RKJ61392.1 XRE family transcriptional regulator [bacterium 1XD42-1]